jgi:hypothetical protein
LVKAATKLVPQKSQVLQQVKLIWNSNPFRTVFQGFKFQGGHEGSRADLNHSSCSSDEPWPIWTVDRAVQISPKRTNKKREKRYQLKADMTNKSFFLPSPPPTHMYPSFHAYGLQQQDPYGCRIESLSSSTCFQIQGPFCFVLLKNCHSTWFIICLLGQFFFFFFGE